MIFRSRAKRGKFLPGNGDEGLLTGHLDTHHEAGGQINS